MKKVPPTLVQPQLKRGFPLYRLARPRAQWYQLRGLLLVGSECVVHNTIVPSSSHGEVTCHRPWTFPFVYQDLKSSQETPILTIELPDKMYPTIQCKVKCPMIRQRYSTLQEPISGYQPQVGSNRVALISNAVRTLGNGQNQQIVVSFTTI